MFRLTIMPRELLACIQAANVVTESGLKIPVLESTHISVTDNSAMFTATNTDQSVSRRAACKGDGAALLNTAALLQKCGVLRADTPVEFDGDGRTVAISQGRTKWSMPCLPPIDFPIASTGAIQASPVPISIVEILPNLAAAHGGVDPRVPDIRKGVYFDFENGLHLVGCSKSTVNVCEIQDFGKIEQRSFVLPDRAIGQVQSLFKGASDAKISASEVAFTIEADGLFYRTKLLEGTYVPYRKIIPDEYTGSALVDAGEFTATVKRAIAIRDDGKSFKMKIRIEEDITISARNVDGEESQDVCRADHDGRPIEFIMSHVFLMKAIESLNCDVLRIEYTERERPLFFSANGSTRENFRAVAPMAF